MPRAINVCVSLHCSLFFNGNPAHAAMWEIASYARDHFTSNIQEKTILNKLLESSNNNNICSNKDFPSRTPIKSNNKKKKKDQNITTTDEVLNFVKILKTLWF